MTVSSEHDTPAIPDRSDGHWRTFWLMAAAILAMSLAVLARSGDFIENVRLLIRCTARTSAAFFLLAFLASSLHRIWPNPTTAWLVRDRRQLGLAFAFSHTVHAAAIYTYWKTAPDIFWHHRTVAGNIPGTFGYTALIVLVLTSSNRAVELLGRPLWQRIHKFAIWTIFLVFFVAWGKRVSAEPLYAVPFAIFTAAALVRLSSARLGRIHSGRPAA